MHQPDIDGERLVLIGVKCGAQIKDVLTISKFDKEKHLFAIFLCNRFHK